MRKIIAVLSIMLTMGFAVGCQQQQGAGGQQQQSADKGNCELGAKSGGTVTATEAECRDLGGRYTG